jgi:hypothetical protein
MTNNKADLKRVARAEIIALRVMLYQSKTGSSRKCKRSPSIAANDIHETKRKKTSPTHLSEMNLMVGMRGTTRLPFEPVRLEMLYICMV